MNKDNHLIFEALVQSRAPVSDEQAAKMITDKIKGTPNLNIQNIKMYVQKYLGLVGKAPSDIDFIASMVHDNLQNMGMGENAENAQQFTVVSGGVDNTSEVGIDINPADHIHAHSLKDAAEETLGEMQGDEDFDDTFPEEYREYVKDIFMMSNDSGDFIAILPGHLNEDQIFNKLVDVRDNNSENAEDRSVQAGGAIEDITDIQNKSVHLLKQHGFHVNKVSNAHAEQQGGPMVYMGRKTGMMHQVAEVDAQGMINEETPEEYLANHVHAEDAEGRSNAQHAAIAISLQKAGKKPS